MAKNKNESNNKNSGTLLTEKDGTQYFVMGKVRGISQAMDEGL